MSDNEFLSNFPIDRACIHHLQELVKDNEFFSKAGQAASYAAQNAVSQILRKLWE